MSRFISLHNTELLLIYMIEADAIGIYPMMAWVYMFEIRIAPPFTVLKTKYKTFVFS